MSAWTLLDADDGGPHRPEVRRGEVAVLSRRGPGKDRNEDAAAIVEVEEGLVMVVADGMGGHASGDEASRLAVREVARALEAEPAGGTHALLDGVEAANRAVLALGVGAGATLACVEVRGERARSLHVGDAGVVHLGQRGRVKRRTLDHGPTAYAVRAGLLDEVDALHHEERHLVTNFVGSEAMHVELGPWIPIAPRDTLVVASDGLFDNLFLEEIVDGVRSGPLEVALSDLAARCARRMDGLEPDAPSKPDDLTVALYRRGR